MNFDWTKPVIIDWSGRRGPLITEPDIKNSVLKRILRNQYHAPFCERPCIPVKPWWNPQDPFGAQVGNIQSVKNDRFIPGLRPMPLHPQLSTLTKTQHIQGLRVLSRMYNKVQPRMYPKPNQKDYAVFEEIKELYEAEKKEYVSWAKLLWINGDCIRSLRPKPALENVYDAEFKMRMHEMQSMPQNYALAAQIPLETKSDEFEMKHQEDLIKVNVRDLPLIDYPEEMECDFSVLLKSCPVPEPCAEHPCKFILPHEDTVSVLPLSEVHRELAQYAAAHGCNFVASESALRCLLEPGRSWKSPVSVVEVTCPEFGELKTVIVLGSEFTVQKECSRQRTYKAYKHLLRHTFARSPGQYKSKTPTKQNITTTASSPIKTTTQTVTKEQSAPRLDRFVSLDDLDVSDDNDSDTLLIDDNEPNSKLKDCSEPGRQICIQADNPDSDMFDDKSKSSRKPNNKPKMNDKAEEKTPEGNQTNYGLDFYEPDYYNAYSPSYSHNKPQNNFDQKLLDAGKENPEPVDFYVPNGSDTNKARPTYSHDQDEPSSQPDQLFIDDPSKVSQEQLNSKPNYSNEPRSSPDRLLTSAVNPGPSCSIDFYDPSNRNDTRPSYSNNEPSSSPDRLFVDYASETNILNVYEANSRASQDSSHQLMINDDDEINREPDHQDSCDQNYGNDSSDSCKSETNNVNNQMSNKIENQVTNEPLSSLFETIKDSNNFDKDIPILYKTYDETASLNSSSSNVDATESNIDATESYIDSAQSLFHTNNDISESNVDATKINQVTSVTKALSSDAMTIVDMISDSNNSNETCNTKKPKIVSDEPMTSVPSNIADSQKAGDVTLKMPSPVKPYTISVRNLSLYEAKAYNVSELFNNPPIEVSSKMKNDSETNRNVSGVNASTDISKASTRLGISGIITRNRRSLLNVSVNEPTTPITEKTTNLSIKPTKKRSVRISNNTAEKVIEPLTTGTNKKVAETVEQPIQENIDDNCPVRAVRRSGRLRNSGPEVVIITETYKANVGDNKLINDAHDISKPVRRSARLNNDPQVITAVEPYSKPSVNETNKDIGEKSEKTSEIPIKSSAKRITRKRSISTVDNEVAKVVEPTVKVVEAQQPNNTKSTVRRTVEESEHVSDGIEANLKKSPLKPCIVKSSDRNSPKSARKLSFSAPVSDADFIAISSTEATLETATQSIKSTEAEVIRSQINDSDINEPRSKRVRKRSDQINREHDYCHSVSENSGTAPEPRKRSISEIEHDCCQDLTMGFAGSNCDSNPISVNPNSDDRKPSFNMPVLVKTEPSYDEPESEISYTQSTSVPAKTVPQKNISNEFLSESHSDELISNASFRETNAKYARVECASKMLSVNTLKAHLSNNKADSQSKSNTRKLSFSEPLSDKPSSEKSPLKPCLRKNSIESPRNSKRKLSFSDPLTSDPEQNGISEVDSEESITGFRNGVAVPRQSLQKSSKEKQKNTVIRTYSLRSKAKPNPTKVAEKLRTTENNKNNIKTKVPLNKRYNTRKITEKIICISCSDTDDSDFSRSRRNSTISNASNKSNKQYNTVNVSSRRKSQRTYSNENRPDVRNIFEGLRRSRRLSDRSNTKENTPPKSNTELFTNPYSKITKKYNRRKSLPANIFSDNHKINRIFRSKSLTNLSETTKTKRINKVTSTTRCTRSKSTSQIKDINKSLKLSERTKRYLRRVFNFDCSDQSENGEMSERTQRYIRRSISSACSGTEQSDTEIIRRTKKYTRSSSMAPNARKTNKRGACTTDNESERTKRCIRRSTAMGYSSCEEDDQPIRMRKKKTRRQPREGRSTDTTSNKMDTSSTTEVNEDQTIQPKTEVIDIADEECLNNETDQYTTKYANVNKIETFKIKVDVSEETDEVETMNILHYTELSHGICEAYSSCSEDLNTTNQHSKDTMHSMDLENMKETEVEESKLFYYDRNEMEASDSEQFYDSCSNTLSTANYKSKNTDVQPIKHQTNKTFEINHKEIDQNDNLTMQTEHEIGVINTTDGVINTNNEIRSRKYSFSEASNSSDYFDVNEVQELNIFHFTATNESDSENSEEDFLIDDSQTEAPQTYSIIPENEHSPGPYTAPSVEKQYPTHDNLTDETAQHIKPIYGVDKSSEEADSQTEAPQTYSIIPENEHSPGPYTAPSVEKQYPTHNNLTDETAQHIKPIYGVDKSSEEADQEISQAKDETEMDSNKTPSPNKPDRPTEGYHSSENMSCQNEMLQKSTLTKDDDIIGVYSCTCKGTLFETPPPRSFKKWRVRNKNSNLSFDMIVHSSHRARKGGSEMLLEPIVEYQPELGGCKQSADRIRSLALSFMLRQTAGLINVRIDHENGNVIVVDKKTKSEFIAQHGDKRGEISNILHTTLGQLRFLMPGQYLLTHDPNHGANAMLYSTKGVERSADILTLNLRPDNTNMPDADEATLAKIPPELDSVLLPCHKYRSILPLAFTTYKSHVREDKKVAAALAKTKPPPQAIQWPKKRKRAKKPRANRPTANSQPREL